MENYVIVLFGMSPCSQTTTPVDLPDAEEMRAAYNRVVKASEQYQAHHEWANVLSLKVRVVDPLAYFVGYFFPCSPDCEAALFKGRECLSRLVDLDTSMGGVYTLLGDAEHGDRLPTARGHSLLQGQSRFGSRRPTLGVA